MPYLRKASRVSGTIFNPDYNLKLEFQFNPTTISRNKEVSYESITIPGLDSLINLYTSGGQSTINFEISLDARPVEENKDLYGREYDPSVGLNKEIAVIQSFLRPRPIYNINQKAVVDSLNLDEGFLAAANSNTFFVSPPDAYFSYGNKWDRCKIISASIEEVIHNEFLVPVRITVPFSLLVLESGSIHEDNENKRINFAYNTSNSYLTETINLT